MKNKPKILVVLGPTATGKSDLAVKLAKKFKGEIISADSRQVYKHLNIGSGKVTKKEMGGIPHYLLDVANPKKVFTVSKFKQLAEEKIKLILKNGKVPIIAGGTGFYIQSIIDDLQIPEIPPNKTLRNKLEKKDIEELFKILKKIDPKRAKMIDKKNPRRLIRAIEIAKALGKVPPYTLSTKPYTPFIIGIDLPDKKLKEKIEKRLIARIKIGMIAEAQKLHKRGLSFKRMRELGLEYKYLADFLDKKISKEKMIKELGKAIWQYAKRQRTWFKKDTRTRWFHPNQFKIIEKQVRKFLY